MIIGGQSRDYLSDIEAVSFDDDNINCDHTDLPYKVSDHASVYIPVLNGILTCGGEYSEYREYSEYSEGKPDSSPDISELSKCILQRKGNDSDQFPALNSGRYMLSMTSIADNIYAIGGCHGECHGGLQNKNTMETINLNTDRQWKKEEMPFSVYGHCSVKLGNKIIVTGGFDENGNVSKLMLKFT